MRLLRILLFVSFILLNGEGGGANPVSIPPTLFGMTITDSNAGFPSIPFGVHRFWDTSGAQWPFLNPAPGVYRWQGLDSMLRKLKTLHVSAGFYTLSRTPSWASSNPGDMGCEYYSPGGTGPHGPGQCDPPKDLRRDGTGTDQIWRTWVAALASHVESLDPKTYLHITYWEPWNEIFLSKTLNNRWRIQASSYSGTFAQLVRMTQDARCILKGDGAITATRETCAAVLKSVGLSKPIEPSSVMVMPSAAPYPAPLAVAANFLYCDHAPPPGSICTTGDGGARAIDAVNFHIKFPTEPPEDILKVAHRIRSILKLGELRKPLVNGEAGYAHPENHPGSSLLDPDMQASFVARYYLLQWSSGISLSNWYTWDGRGTGLWSRSHGIKKAGTAYGEVYRWMVGAVMPSPCSQEGTVWRCVLTRRDGYRAEALWDTSQMCSRGICTTRGQKIPSIYRRYRNLSGNIFPIHGRVVPVGIKPILLENQLKP